VKVCPHCAEELPDDATVCPECHKSPTEAPAWATTARRDESQPSWPDDRSQPGGDPSIPEIVPTPHQRLEPAVARRSGIPPTVGASLIIAVAWGYVAGFLTQGLAQVISPDAAFPSMRILGVAGFAVGLILAKVGRAEVEDSDRIGHILVSIGIWLNAIHLAFYLIPFVIALAVSSGSQVGGQAQPVR
jgi:hypothetical protein